MMPSSNAKTTYDDLLKVGFNTNQAIGAMANAMNESSFNPEAVGDQGTSYGEWQWHNDPHARSLVTGNISKDIADQSAYFKQTAGGSAGGSSPADIAGNIAAGFERCVGCQPGGTQWNARRANAATIEGWVKSGKWPTSSGSGISTAGIHIPGTGINIPTPGDLANALNPVKWLETAIGNTFKDILTRLGLILLGGILIIIGVYVLVRAQGNSTDDMKEAIGQIFAQEQSAKTVGAKTVASESGATATASKAALVTA